MSLINKMLQDLDARGGGRGDAWQQRELKAVPAPERGRRPLLLAGAALAAVAVAVAVGGWYGWQAAHRPAPGPVPVMVPTPGPAAAADLAAAPAAMPATDPGAANAGPALSVSSTPGGGAGAGAGAATGEAAAPVPAAPAAPAPVADAAAAPGASPGDASAPDSARAPSAAASAATARARMADIGGPRPLRQLHQLHQPRQSGAAVGADSAVTTSAELTPTQRSENTYRRALAALQDGRLSAAMTDLDRALDIDPRNEAARQTYVSLLLENRRTDDAIRQLRLALGIDPRQPGLAMVLARLQLERGGPALETLMATLPHAAANADYQAFLAGVLQREQRHAEAARYYQAALKLSPLNGVWWMGLGISLQADQHRAEAREAFTRARTGNGVTPELLAFIDRRLDQLSRSAP